MKFANLFPLKKPLILSFCGGILLFSSLFLYLFDPLTIIIKKMTAFYEGSISFKSWKNPEYEIFIKLYIFNVTNIDNFQNGRDSKLKVQEIGPFVYQEQMSNTDIEFYKNGTMSYVPHKNVKFIPEKSIGDPKLINVTVPNIPLLGILSFLDQSSFVVQMALSSVISYLDSKPFLTLSAHDYLWGYDDPLIRLANNVAPSWIFFRKFGILDRLFDEGNNTVTIVTDVNTFNKASGGNELLKTEGGIKQFSIHKWNGSPGLSHWGYVDTEGTNHTSNERNTFCNLLEGSFEGIMFPRNIGTNFTFRLYRKAFCRTLQFVYKDQGVINNRYYGYIFKLRDNFLDRSSENVDNKCYCDSKDTCVPKGFSLITPCYYGIPIAISLPHFMNTDYNIQNSIEGLRPNKSLHESSFAIHPKLGIPLKVNCRIQLNLAINAKYHSRTPIFENRIVPLFWIEFGVDKPPKTLEFYLTLLYDILPLVNYAVIFLCGLIGFIFFILLTFQLTFKTLSESQKTNNFVQKDDLKKMDIPLETIVPLLDNYLR